MITAILVGHRAIGEGVKEALEAISGPTEGIVVISNEGRSTRDLTEVIHRAVEESGNAGSIIFVDVFGGSCWRSAKHALGEHSRLVTGYNLPMLLSFMHKRENYPIEELPAIMETDGKRGITSE